MEGQEAAPLIKRRRRDNLPRFNYKEQTSESLLFIFCKQFVQLRVTVVVLHII